MAKHLTNEQLEQLTSRKDVRRKTVKSFLSSISLSIDARGPYGANQSLSDEAVIYRWNAATVQAIRDGIQLMFNS